MNPPLIIIALSLGALLSFSIAIFVSDRRAFFVLLGAILLIHTSFATRSLRIQ